jgi:hypothetical protein
MSKFSSFLQKESVNIKEKSTQSKITIKSTQLPLRLKKLTFSSRNLNDINKYNSKQISLKSLYKTENTIESEQNSNQINENNLETIYSSNLTPKAKHFTSMYSLYTLVK